MQSSLESIYASVPTTSSHSNVGAPDNHLLPRHRWYTLKESFSPQVVHAALSQCSVDSTEVVIDPFSGSGTSVVSATLLGRRAVGFEVNPFLSFVSNTKLLDCSHDSFDHNIPIIVKGINRGAVSQLASFSTFSDTGDRDKWLFNPLVLMAFEGGWRASSSVPLPARDLMRLALIGSAMDVCNAVKDGKCLRYRKNWDSLRFNKKDFLEAFEIRIEQIKVDLNESPISNSQSAVYLGDAREDQIWSVISGRFKLCVASPPYLNSFDYTDVYRPELFLGKFVKNQRELTQLRQLTIRSHVQAKWPDPTTSDFGDHFTNTAKSITAHQDTLWNKRLPLMIQAYFEDISKVLSLLLERASANAQVWLVVSTSAYAGIEIPVDIIVGELAQKIGWQLRELSTIRHLRRISVQQWERLSRSNVRKPFLRESLIVLEHSASTVGR